LSGGKRNPLHKLVFIVLTVIAGVEILFRLFISTPCTQVYDPVLGYVNMPFGRYVESMEGYSVTRFNSLGWNDREPLRDNKVRRIFVIGNSYTEAFQVYRDRAYVQIAEQLLHDQQEKLHVDLMRLGRDGFTLLHYPVIIDRLMGRFKPEIIVLQLSAFSGDDLYGNDVLSEYNKHGRLLSLQIRPRAEDRTKEYFRRIINNSALAYYIIRKHKAFFMKLLSRPAAMDRVPEQTNLPAKNSQKSLVDMTARIGFVLDEVLKYGTTVLVLYLPPSGSYLKETTQKGQMTRAALGLAVEKRGIHLIDLSQEFVSDFARTGQVLEGFANTRPGEGHLNLHGHAVVGTVLAEQLAKIMNEHQQPSLELSTAHAFPQH
jgi:hypothetical protein